VILNLNKQADIQREKIATQTAKMKELFLKEYEELINEKNSEIKQLNEQLSTVNYDTKDLNMEIQGMEF
jgi:hypothetical protein